MGNALSWRKRREIVEYDPLVSGASVREFCGRLGVSTSSFYRLRERARAEGADAALVARSRAPLVPARKYGSFLDELVAHVHHELTESGLDAGPWSVWWRLEQEGISPVPSRSTIARRLRALGLSSVTPGKRPRSSWQRFQRSRANELWQLDAFDWQIGTDPVTVHEIIDDCTRMKIGLLAVMGGESIAGARAALEAGFAAFGKPAAVLTDNHSSVNQHRQGRIGEVERWLAGQGIRPISGRVRHPQTQGKVERTHQNTLKWLGHHAHQDLDQLNQVLADFARYFNHERQHQGLGLRVTPAMAWASVDKDGPLEHPIPVDQLYGRQPLSLPPRPARPSFADRRVDSGGRLRWAGRTFQVGERRAGQLIHVIHTDTDVELFDHDGVQIGQIPWPQPGSTTSINVTRLPFAFPSDLSQKPLTPNRPGTNDIHPSQKS